MDDVCALGKVSLFKIIKREPSNLLAHDKVFHPIDLDVCIAYTGHGRHNGDIDVQPFSYGS